MLEPREFAVDQAASNPYLAPKRLLYVVPICVMFVAAGIWLLMFDAGVEAKVAGAGAIAFFGGGGILAFVLVSLRSMLGFVARIRVDTNGITWTNGYRALASFGLGPRTRTIPWSNITELRVADTREIPMVQASLARQKAGPFGSMLPAPPTIRYVGVVVRDLDAAIGQQSLSKTASRTLYELSGSFVAGPVAGLSPEEFLQTLETYRAAARN